MTDEEMAEEYAKAHIVQYPKRVIINENGFCTSEDEVKQAFLAGLKAGIPQWHYVKDGDLPKGNDAVLIYWKFGEKKCASVVEPYKVAEDKDVIAWKEIVLPELKESE